MKQLSVRKQIEKLRQDLDERFRHLSTAQHDAFSQHRRMETQVTRILEEVVQLNTFFSRYPLAERLIKFAKKHKITNLDLAYRVMTEEMDAVFKRKRKR